MRVLNIMPRQAGKTTLIGMSQKHGDILLHFNNESRTCFKETYGDRGGVVHSIVRNSHGLTGIRLPKGGNIYIDDYNFIASVDAGMEAVLKCFNLESIYKESNLIAYMTPFQEIDFQLLGLIKKMGNDYAVPKGDMLKYFNKESYDKVEKYMDLGLHLFDQIRVVEGFNVYNF